MYINWLHNLDDAEKSDLLTQIVERLPEPDNTDEFLDDKDGCVEVVDTLVADCVRYGAK